MDPLEAQLQEILQQFTPAELQAMDTLEQDDFEKYEKLALELFELEGNECSSQSVACELDNSSNRRLDKQLQSSQCSSQSVACELDSSPNRRPDKQSQASHFRPFL